MKINCPLLILASFVPAFAIADHTTVTLPTTVNGPNTSSLANLPDAGETGFSIQYQRIDFEGIPTFEFDRAADSEESLHGTDSIDSTSFNFTWGVNDRLTLGISIPRLERTGLVEAVHHHDIDEELHGDEEEHHDDDADHHEEEQESAIEYLGSAKGIGDARIYANYQLWASESSQASLLFGVKAPTGKDDELSLDGHLLEAEFQPGSGSWDTMLGVAYSTGVGAWTFDSNLLYSFVTEGSQVTDLGDIFNYNFAFSYPVNMVNGGSQSSWRVALLLEANGEWRERVNISGQDEKNSGGNLLYLSPGLSLSNGSWFGSLSFGKAIENLNGVQSQPENRLVLSFGRAF